jgi:hypothetical protein
MAPTGAITTTTLIGGFQVMAGSGLANLGQSFATTVITGLNTITSAARGGGGGGGGLGSVGGLGGPPGPAIGSTGPDAPQDDSSGPGNAGATQPARTANTGGANTGGANTPAQPSAAPGPGFSATALQAGTRPTPRPAPTSAATTAATSTVSTRPATASVLPANAAGGTGVAPNGGPTTRQSTNLGGAPDPNAGARTLLPNNQLTVGANRGAATNTAGNNSGPRATTVDTTTVTGQ